MSSGIGVQVLDEVINRFGGQIGVVGQRGVDVGDVGLVMLVVVQVHGLGIDKRFESQRSRTEGVQARKPWGNLLR